MVVRTEGEPPSFDFEPRDHVALVEMNDWADLSRITQVAGSRMYALKGRLALLEQALMFWAQQIIAADGFTLMTVPALGQAAGLRRAPAISRAMRKRPMRSQKDGLYLAGTGEIALTSPPFGRDTRRGAAADPLCRLFALLPPRGGQRRPRRSRAAPGPPILQARTICDLRGRRGGIGALARPAARQCREAAARALEIPYQVVETSTGDMGLGKYRMNDIESWVPSLGKYRETHSCSTLHDWQARRANLRWRDGERKVRFVHTLNNTALASPANPRPAAREPPAGRTGGCGCPRRCGG